jgi:hypothetical protein
MFSHKESFRPADLGLASAAQFREILAMLATSSSQILIL